MNAIVLIGKTAVGKSTCAQFLEKRYGYHVFEIGDYVRKIHKCCATKEKLVLFADRFYKNGEITTFVKIALADAILTDNPPLFSGVRTIEEVELIKKVFPSVIIIRLSCGNEKQKIYYKKTISDNTLIEERNVIESQWHLPSKNTLQINYEIANDGSIEDLFNNINRIMILLENGVNSDE